ncbi:MAG: GerAB/ArcD/ProY family transporter [Oscillospiraceae bacterium]
MTKSNKKISVYQLFCLMIFTRLSAEIVFPNRVSYNSFESLVTLLISELVQFVLALPVIVYSFKGEDFYRAIYRKNRFFGWLFGIGAALILLGAAIMTLFYSSEFTIKNLLIGGFMWVIFVLAAIFAVYAAIMGTEALARAGAIFLVGAAIVTLTVILSDIPYMRFTTLEFSLSGDMELYFKELIQGMKRGADYLIFAALLPYVNKKTSASAGKCGLLYGLFSVLFTAIICAVSSVVLRELYSVSEYPFIAAASLSDIVFFKRLDGAAAAIWALGAVFRAGVMLLSAVMILRKVYEASQVRRKGEAG